MVAIDYCSSKIFKIQQHLSDACSVIPSSQQSVSSTRYGVLVDDNDDLSLGFCTHKMPVGIVQHSHVSIGTEPNQVPSSTALVSIVVIESPIISVGRPAAGYEVS